MNDLIQVSLVFLCFFGCCVALGHFFLKGVDLVVSRFIKKKNVVSSSDAVVMETRVETRKAMVQTLLDDQQITDIKYFTRSGSMVADKFFSELNERFAVEVRSAYCSYDRSGCTSLFKLTGHDGKVYFITVHDGTNDMYAYNNDGSTRPRFKFVYDEYDNIENYKDDNEEIRLISKFDIVYNSVYNDNSPDLVSIREICESCEVYYVQQEYVVQDSVTMYDVTYDGGYIFIPSSNTVTRLGEKANSLYAPISVNYSDQNYDIKPMSAIELGALGLATDKNLYIWGAPGTGKTSILAQIMALSHDEYEDVAIINLTPAVFREVQTAAGLQQFTVGVKGLGASKVVFVMDEAESLLQRTGNVHSEVTSALLQLLDGDLRKKLNCNTVLVFNADKSHLDQAVFRAGREGLSFHLQPLTESVAKKAVHTLREDLKDYVFNEQRYQKLLSEENKDVTGAVYSASNCITLADLLSCFLQKAQNDKFIDAIREAAALHKEDFNPQPDGFTLVIPEPEGAKVVRKMPKLLPSPQSDRIVLPLGSSNSQRKNRNKKRRR